MRIQFNIDTAGLEKSLNDYQAKLRAAVGKAMSAEAKTLRQSVRSHVSGQLNVTKKSFLNSFRTKVLDQDPNRLPGLYVGSKIPWVGMHEYGGAIAGKMLIPIYGRVGRKRFKEIVDALMRSGNAFFIKHNGKTLLMSENIQENDAQLAGFKRRYRKAEGIKRLKRGTAVPIAMLVTKVDLRKRLDVVKLVESRVPGLVKAIGREIGKIG